LWFRWPWYSLGMALHLHLLGSRLVWVRLALGIAIAAVASLWWVVGREMWLLGLVISVVLITTAVTKIAHTARASLVVELVRTSRTRLVVGLVGRVGGHLVLVLALIANLVGSRNTHIPLVGSILYARSRD